AYVESANYDCVLEDGPESGLDAAINDDNSGSLANWTGDASPGYTGSDVCGFFGQAGPSATQTQTYTTTPFETSTPTYSATLSPTQTPVESPTSTETGTPSATQSPLETPTPSSTATLSFTQTPMESPSPSSTDSPTATTTPAGTAFNPGDIAFVAYSAYQEQFSVVLLQPMAVGTTLYFTNDGWETAGSSPSSPPTQLSTNDKYIEVTSSNAYPAGTVLTYYYNAPGDNGGTAGALSATTGTGLQDVGAVSRGGSGSLGLKVTSSAPSTLSVYQGSPTDATVITAMMAGGTWNTATGGNCPCNLPWNLTDSQSSPGGNTAWSTLTANYVESAYYDCATEDGSESALDAAVNDDANGALANWVPDGTSPGYTGADVCGFMGQAGPSATLTPTYTTTQFATPTPSYSATPSFTQSPFETPTSTYTETPVESPTPTSTVSPTRTASPTASPSPATSLLSQGDVMIVALSGASKSAAGKQIAFEFMKDISAGTSVGICNANWASGAFVSPNAHYVVWTADQAYPAGTVVTYGRPACGNTNCITADKGVISEGGTDTSGIGFSQPKLLVVFQGTTSNPVLLNAVLMGSTWGASGGAADAVPANGNGALVDGQTATQFGTFPDWAGYDCAVATGSEASQDAAIDADPQALPTNWTISDSDTTDTLATFSPPWEPCSLRIGVGGNYGYSPPQPPKPLAGPVPAHAGQPVYFAPLQDAASSQFWVYSLTGRLVSTLGFGAASAGAPPTWLWATQNMAPGIYRVKSKVVYADGSTYEGWLNIAVVP
ncbi:MAG TPA: hypothetical protein VK914_00980, partial [bacterium]|nr:hypothetical protein [bacterium]